MAGSHGPRSDGGHRSGLAKAPAQQKPPGKGTQPRADVADLAKRIDGLPHRLLAYRGADGFPVIVPVAVAGHDEAGLCLSVSPGWLPPGGRRAGFLAHSFQAQCVGLSMRVLTGWLTGTNERRALRPHTPKGLAAPSYPSLL